MNIHTLIALNTGKEPRKVNSFDFGRKLAMDLLTPHLYSRERTGFHGGERERTVFHRGRTGENGRERERTGENGRERERTGENGR